MAKRCRYCETILSNPRRVQCGEPECLRRYNNERCAKWSRGYTARNGHSIKKHYRKPADRVPCSKCKRPLKGTRTATPTCRACAHVPRPTPTRKDLALRKIARAAAGSSRGWVLVGGRCRRCGDQFMCQLAGSPAEYCRVQCKRLDKSAKRRARQRGVKLTPGRRHAVFERDGWTCRICGDPTNREAQVPDLDAPVIDHIIPLAQGGEHGPENWQTAHFYCNSVKRDLLDFDGGVDHVETAAA